MVLANIVLFFFLKNPLLLKSNIEIYIVYLFGFYKCCDSGILGFVVSIVFKIK